jgi:hypothetical protein
VAPPPSSSENLITVQECGKAGQKCRVLKRWCLADGTPARDVQDVATGEIMTILDCVPKNMACLPGCSSGTCAAAPPAPASSQVYHWGASPSRPTGVPTPAGSSDGTMVTAPKSESGGVFRRWLGSSDKVTQAPVMTQPTPVQQPVVPAQRPAQSVMAPAVVPAQKPTQSVAVPPSKPSTNPFLSAMRPTPVAAAPGKHPEADAGCAKVGVAPPDASGAKPAQVGDACCRKPANPVGSSTAAADKPFQGTPGTHPTYATGSTTNKSLVKSVDAAQPTDWRRSWGKPENAQSPPTQTAQTPPVPSTVGSRVAQEMAKPVPPPLPPQESAGASAQKPDVVKAPVPPPTWPDVPANPVTPETKTATVQAKPPTMETKPATAQPKPTASESKPMQTVKIELPHADTKQPDPLMKPEERAQRTLDKKASVLKPVDAAAAPALPAAVAKADPGAAPTPATPAAAAPANQPRVPLGAGSVLAAYANNPGGIIYLPVPVVTLPASTAPRQLPTAPHAPAAKPGEEQANAFSPVKSTPGSDAYANAFSTESAPTQITMPPNAMSSPQQQSQMAMQMQSPLPTNCLSAGYAYRSPPQMYQGPMPPSPVVQANYDPNAQMFPSRQMPYPPGYSPVQPAYCPPAVPSAPYYPPSSVAQPAASPAAAISGQSVQQLLLTMKDALYPSHREWAAEALVNVDWRANPQVVDALLLTAKDDPAPTVRSGAVRALARMNVNTSSVVATLQALKGDTDPRVRQDVEQALANLGNPPAVQPAGGFMPTDAK